MIYFFILVILVSILQVFICKKATNYKLGLIIPFLSLISVIAPAISSLAILLPTIEKIDKSIIYLILDVIIVLLFSLIPFFIFISIYFYLKKNYRVDEESV